MSDSAVHTKVAPQASVSKPLPVNGLLQRKCACGQHTGGGGECESCRKKREDANAKKPGTLQRAAITSAPTPTAKATTDSAAPKVSIPKAPTAPPIVHDVLRSPGKQLDAGTRSFMEPRFGQDFSQVRVHTDNKAADSARAVNARAYTVGQHVVFGPGEFAPDTTGGRHLLAHELTHTMQQDGMLHPMQSGGLTIAAADSALEHEADIAAHAVGTRGSTFKKGQRRPSGPVISRKVAKIGERDEQDTLKKSQQLHVGTGQTVVAIAERDARTVAFDIDKFIVPDNKGPQAVYDLYDAQAQAGALEATIKVSGKSAGLWQKRAGSTSLRKDWRLKVGWINDDTDAVNKLWAKAGGDKKGKGKGGFPKVNEETCEIDHIIELQLGGTNVPNNVQVLGPTENGESGRTIHQQVSSIAQEILDDREEQNKLGLGKDIKEIILHFKSAQTGKAISQKPKSCTAVELNAAAAAKEDVSSEAAKDEKLQEYIVTAAALEASLRTPEPGKEKISTPLRESSIPENKAGSELIAGLVLETLHQPAHGKGTDTIDAFIDAGKHSRRQGTRLPIELKEGKKQGALQLNVHKDKAGKGKLSFDSKSKKRVGFTYPYLSEGYLIPEFNEETGFSAKGKINKPSIPLLSKAEIDVVLEQDTFSGKVSVPKDKLSPPVKGFRVTKGEVGVELSPVFGASGEVAFEVGPEKKPIVDGSIKAKADENGFVAQGKVNAHLPGIDKAEGDITYRKDGFSGGIDVNFGQTKLKYIKGGTAHIGFIGSEIKAEGAIIIQLPRGKEATVSVHRGPQGNWIYKGSGEFDIPKLDPVKLEIEYDGEHLTARGHTGIVLQGLKGDLSVLYKDGRVSGEGKLALEKGRAKGFVHAKLSDALNISGEGEIQYQLSENLIGTVGVVLHEDQSVRVRGALEFPKPIHLFKGFGEEYTLFNYGMQIPILAIPLGPVSAGLVGTIDGGMKVNYGLGPGELRGVHVMAAFNPLAESKDLELEAGATLVIPAHAGISVYIRGGVGVSVAIASVTGGITATGTAELRGGLEAPVSIKYVKSKFILDAEPKILAELVLKLGLDADITAEAGVRGFKVEKKIVWNLAAFEWGSGLQFGLTAPLHYASDEPFRAPSASDIKFVKPNIDLKGLVPRLAKQAGGSKE